MESPEGTVKCEVPTFLRAAPCAECQTAGFCIAGERWRVAKNTAVASLPTDSAERKDIPLARGVLDYFPAALAEVAKLSKAGNDKHNPGEPLHWARGKSMDHADCIMRHLAERGKIDTDGLSHTVKVAWRALALLQEECEQMRGAPLPRGARIEEHRCSQA